MTTYHYAVTAAKHDEDEVEAALHEFCIEDGWDEEFDEYTFEVSSLLGPEQFIAQMNDLLPSCKVIELVYMRHEVSDAT